MLLNIQKKMKTNNYFLAANGLTTCIFKFAIAVLVTISLFSISFILFESSSSSISAFLVKLISIVLIFVSSSVLFIFISQYMTKAINKIARQSGTMKIGFHVDIPVKISISTIGIEIKSFIWSPHISLKKNNIILYNMIAKKG